MPTRILQSGRKERRVFGYVRPREGDLLVKELEFYKATYCGICRAMKHQTGALSNITLSYDSVFLALVRMIYLDDSEFSAKKVRCIAHPINRCKIITENSAIEYTARVFALLAHHKIRDDKKDEGFCKRAILIPVAPIAKRGAKKAKLSDLSKIFSEKLAALAKMEEDKEPSVDLAATTFGELLGEAFAYGFSDNDRRILYQCGYHLGRFIYAADAAEDYEKDKKRGKYNPFVILYGGKELTPEDKKAIKTGLILECQGLESAIDLLPFGSKVNIENIIRNIIYCGLIDRIAFLDSEKKQGENK